MLTFCYFWTDLVIRAVVTISAILLKYPTSESGFHALKYKYIIRVYLHYREKTVKFCLIKYVPYWAKINLITWTSNLKSKRLLTFIFSVRISFWLSLLPWPQAWGHIFLVSWLRFKIYSIFWLNLNNFLKVILSLWVLILIWSQSDEISSSLNWW